MLLFLTVFGLLSAAMRVLISLLLLRLCLRITPSNVYWLSFGTECYYVLTELQTEEDRVAFARLDDSALERLGEVRNKELPDAPR